VASEVLSRLSAEIQRTGASVRVAEPLPRLKADRMWATQALYNLVANALKFTREGRGPEVEIAPYRAGGAVLGVSVRDRGPGVRPEDAERIFLLFQRAVGRDVEGTGAGLAIVRAVAERHGGLAWARPREGGGSEFIVTFGGTA
jgi:signal transduction histidine kinase